MSSLDHERIVITDAIKSIIGGYDIEDADMANMVTYIQGLKKIFTELGSEVMNMGKITITESSTEGKYWIVNQDGEGISIDKTRWHDEIELLFNKLF